MKPNENTAILRHVVLPSRHPKRSAEETTKRIDKALEKAIGRVYEELGL